MSLMTKIQEALAANPGVSWNDLVLRSLRTATSSTDGALNDLWMRWLASQGYTQGSLGDRMAAYWRANNTPLAERNAFYFGWTAFFGAPPSISDPDFASVASLLPFDGTDGSTTFTDLKGLSWSPVGNAQISTAQSQFGGASALFDGAGDYLTTSRGSFHDWFGVDYTIECWVRPSTLSGWSYADGSQVPTMFGVRNPGSFVNEWSFGPDTSGSLALTYFTGTAQEVRSATGLIIAGVWTHIAFSKQGTTLRLFVNGVQVASATRQGVSITDQSGSGAIPCIGQGNNTTIAGNIDDFRITRGVARYTANFTPPTAAFPTS